jgi:hypothetical protein
MFSMEEWDGNVASRAAFTGVASYAITPARRVPYSTFSDALAANPSVERTRRENGDEVMKSAGARLDTQGAAGTRAAFTGADSYANAPARRVLLDIYLPWRAVNTISEAPDKKSIFTRDTDPFNPDRVACILELVQIGPDLTQEQRERVRAFVAAHADVFALAVSEVRVAKGAVYVPKIPADHEFSLKIHQRPWTKPQCTNVNPQIYELVAAGVLRPIKVQDVKCVNPIHLAEKNQEPGLTFNELLHEVNDQCIRAGLPPVTSHRSTATRPTSADPRSHSPKMADMRNIPGAQQVAQDRPHAAGRHPRQAEEALWT